MMFVRGRATNWTRGSQILPNPDELRMLINMLRSEGLGAKVQVREGKNPDLQLAYICSSLLSSRTHVPPSSTRECSPTIINDPKLRYCT